VLFRSAGADLLNFVPPFGVPSLGPFVISFTVPVTDAMFALVDQNSTYQFTAYLGGTGGAIVDSGSAISPTNPGAGFVGFKNELFDTIKFSGGGSALGMDTLQFNPVPEPSAMVLACLAGAGLAVSALRRRRIADPFPRLKVTPRGPLC
jgi:hypothetical protein